MAEACSLATPDGASLTGMGSETRKWFAEAVRARDLPGAALWCCAEVDPEFDLDAQLDRLQRMGDELATRDFTPTDPYSEASALSAYLGGEVGFTGDAADYHNPRNGLLTDVLDRRTGLPITLSIVYVAVGQLAGMEVYGLNIPAHFLVGAGFDPQAPWPQTQPAWVIDPFHGGRLSDGRQFVDGLRENAQVSVDPDMLTPAETVTVIRRLLNNLTRDFFARADAANALWTVELKRLLPDTDVTDVSAHAQALMQLGRYRDAARTVDNYEATHTTLDESDRAKLEFLARQARAQLN